MRSALSAALVWGYIVAGVGFSGIPGVSRLAAAFCAAMVLGWCVSSVVEGRVPFARWAVVLIPFLAALLLSASLSLPASFAPLSSAAVAWIGAISVYSLVGRGLSTKHIAGALLLSVFVNVLAIESGFDSYSLYGDAEDIGGQLRASGLVGNPNTVAVNAVAALGLCLLLGYKDYGARQFWRWAVSLAWTGATHAVATTGSRKGLMLYVILTALVLGAWAPGRKSLVVAGGVVGASFVALASAFYIYFDRLQHITAFRRLGLLLEGGDSSTYERAHFIRDGISLAIESPIWGFGLDSYRFVSGTSFYSHNNYVELAVSGGALLLVSYYVIHLLIAVRVCRIRDPRLRLVLWVLLGCTLFIDVAMVSYQSRTVAILVCALLLLSHRCVNVNHDKNPCSN